MTGRDRDPSAARITAWATVALALVAILTLALQATGALDGGNPSAASSLTQSASSSSSSSETSGDAPDATPESFCADANGASVRCSDPAAWLIERSSECTSASFLESAAIDPTLLQVDLETRTDAGSCLVRPGETARSANATAADVLALREEGDAVDSLLLCANGGGTTLVACSQRHELEFISPWLRAGDQTDPQSECEAQARTYADMTFGLESPALPAVLQRGSGSEYRCVLQLRADATGTLWRER